MPYISIQDAATLAGCSERTMHRWVQQGKIPAHHVNSRQLAVLDSDVTYFVSQRPQAPALATRAIVATVDELAARVASLEGRIEALTRAIEGIATALTHAPARDAPTLWPEAETARQALAPPLWQEPIETVTQSVSEPAIPASLPEGSMIAAHFAKLHKDVIKERTLTGHLADKLHPVSGIKIGRVWWMTPDQQAAALAFYRWH